MVEITFYVLFNIVTQILLHWLQVAKRIRCEENWFGASYAQNANFATFYRYNLIISPTTTYLFIASKFMFGSVHKTTALIVLLFLIYCCLSRFLVFTTLCFCTKEYINDVFYENQRSEKSVVKLRMMWVRTVSEHTVNKHLSEWMNQSIWLVVDVFFAKFKCFSYIQFKTKRPSSSDSICKAVNRWYDRIFTGEIKWLYF